MHQGMEKINIDFSLEDDGCIQSYHNAGKLSYSCKFEKLFSMQGDKHMVCTNWKGSLHFWMHSLCTIFI